MIFNSFNNLLIGYKSSTRVNDRLLQKDISEDQASSYVNGQLFEDSLLLKKLSNLSILLKQQEKQNKMTFQEQDTSCEEAKTQAQPILTDNC